MAYADMAGMTAEAAFYVIPPALVLYVRVNAASIRRDVKAAVAASETPLVAVVLDLEATVDIDVSGCDALRELAADLLGTALCSGSHPACGPSCGRCSTRPVWSRPWAPT